MLHVRPHHTSARDRSSRLHWNSGFETEGFCCGGSSPFMSCQTSGLTSLSLIFLSSRQTRGYHIDSTFSCPISPRLPAGSITLYGAWSWGKPAVLLVASMPFPSWAVSPETADSMGDMICVPGQAIHVLTFGKSLVTGNKAGVLSVYPSRNAFVVATVISRCFHLRCAFPFPRREEMVFKMTSKVLEPD